MLPTSPTLGLQSELVSKPLAWSVTVPILTADWNRYSSEEEISKRWRSGSPLRRLAHAQAYRIFPTKVIENQRCDKTNIVRSACFRVFLLAEMLLWSGCVEEEEDDDDSGPGTESMSKSRIAIVSGDSPERRRRRSRHVTTALK